MKWIGRGNICALKREQVGAYQLSFNLHGKERSKRKGEVENRPRNMTLIYDLMETSKWPHPKKIGV
jgi:hypothetical protein